MKNFFKNKDNLVILIISLVAFIAGCFGIGAFKSFLIIGTADLIFFLPTIIKKKDKIKKIITKNAKSITNIKQTKSKKKKIIKILILLFFAACLLTIVGAIAFAAYIVKEAPKFDPKKLYAQEASIIYDNKGEIIAKLGTEKREKITYDELPESLVDAIVATEDSRYFQHNGFDLPRFLAASIKQVLSGGSSGGGASTITMQVVKNNFTSTTSSGFEGIKRKFTDIYMAIYQVEKKYTKKEIMEFYVNTYYLGSGAYGVEQACQTYFGKPAKDINLVEAALITGLFQAPNAYDPYNHPDLAEQRRNQVLYLMKRHGYITKEQYDVAISISVESMVKSSETNVSTGNKWQGFIDTVTAEVEEKTGQNPYTTSMEIYTTMDKEKQDYIIKIMNGETYKWPNELATAGIAVTDVKTGAIIAVGAGRDKSKERTFNTATMTNKQIGSTSKPLYDYAPAIEYENFSTYSLFADEPHSYSNGMGVSNWDRRYNGLMTMRTALGQSRNIPALKAFQANKNANIKNFVTSLGLNPEINDNIVHEAHAIGGYIGESPLNMAVAYASFSNGGYYIEPYSYSKIVYRETGESVETKINKTKVMSEETAYMMTSLLQSSAQMGLYSQANINGAVYGAKTGTSNFDAATIKSWGFVGDVVNDLWVTGVSPDYAISVWFGYEKINSKYVSNSYTGNHRTLFQAVGKGVFKNSSTWTKPEGVVEAAVEMESWPAKLASEYTPDSLKVTELFKKGTEPDEVSDRFSKLSSVTNLKGTVSNNKLTLTWSGIDTPNAISDNYLNQYFASLYGDAGYRNNAINNRKAYNNSNIGTLVYKVYSKDSSGNLNFIKETSSNSVDIDINSTSPTTYVVKSSYTIFTRNSSDGTEVKISLADVKVNLSAKLKSSDTVELSIGKTYVEPSDYSTILTVLDGTTDVTNKANITVSYTKGASSVDKIDTTVEGTYIVKHTIVYNGSSTTLNRTIKIIK